MNQVSDISRKEFDSANTDPLSNEKSRKAIEFQRFQTRPNIHQGLHLEDLASEYATPNNLSVLMGEDQHL